MKIVVLQSNYLPWKGYFDLVHDADLFVFYDDVQYTKNDWRNRNRIYAPNGLQWLTVPIPAEAVKLKIREVKMSGASWQEKHFKSLRLAYGRSPHFHQLEPLMKELYLGRSWEFLSELNRFAIQKIARLIGIQTPFRTSSEFELCGGRIERLLDLLVQLQATEYITGPSAKDYLRDAEALFAERKIKPTYKDYSGYPPYPQGRPVFAHDVSIVDMIANLPIHQIGDSIWGWRDHCCPRGDML